MYNKDIHPIITKALMSRGFTPAEVADAMEITPAEFAEWLMQYEELKESAIQGNAIAMQSVEISLFRRTTGYDVVEVTDKEEIEDDGSIKTTKTTHKKNIPPDVKACITWLEVHNPGKWKRQPEQPKAIQQKSSIYCKTCGKYFATFSDYAKNHEGCDKPDAVEMIEGDK